MFVWKFQISQKILHNKNKAKSCMQILHVLIIASAFIANLTCSIKTLVYT